ncbi:beta strand repeat-containing protein [Photobacterium leiognathi subsp. mandapamensis]
MKNILSRLVFVFLFCIFFQCGNVFAVPIYWTDWQSGNAGAGTASGQIITAGSTVTVSYSQPAGYSFIQTSSGADYWVNQGGARDPATSPFTSAFVDNIPTPIDIIALAYQGTNTLTFSEPIANPVFCFVSLNGNGYSFDRDFEILSQTGSGNACGYWGCGNVVKQVFGSAYQLNATSGEPHGCIRFTEEAAFSTVSWTSQSNETWNGFTLGIEGTEAEVFAERDYGDAPDTSAGTSNGDYQTLESNGGANHAFVDTDEDTQVDITLGTLWDGSDSGNDGALQNAAATSDDLDNIDDEDGVSWTDNFIRGGNANISVTITKDPDSTLAGLRLYAWVDWNQDGDWNDASEQIISNTAANSSTQSYPVSIPPTATLGSTYLRVRVCSDADCNSPNGDADDGEVEDYLITVIAPQISGFVFNDNGSGGGTATNGIKDGGESGLGFAVPVVAYNAATGMCYAANADPTTGAYTISAGVVGTYQVYEAINETNIASPTCPPTQPTLNTATGAYSGGTIGDPTNFHSSSANVVSVTAGVTSNVNFGDFAITPFDTCSSDAYLLRNSPTDITGVSLATGAITPLFNNVLPSSTGVFGGTGYNVITNTLFGDNTNNNNTVLMVDGGGNAFVLPITGSTMTLSNYNSGDIDDDGNLLLMTSSGTSLYKIDVNPNSATYLQQVQQLTVSAPVMADMAINPIDNMLYTLTPSGSLVRFDPANGARTNLGSVGAAGTTAVGWGAVYFDDQGFMYASQNPNPGRIIRIDISNPTLPSGSYVAVNFTQMNASTSTAATGSDPDTRATGVATDGEVEDFPVTFTYTHPSIVNPATTDTDNDGVMDDIDVDDDNDGILDCDESLNATDPFDGSEFLEWDAVNYDISSGLADVAAYRVLNDTTWITGSYGANRVVATAKYDKPNAAHPMDIALAGGGTSLAREIIENTTGLLNVVYQNGFVARNGPDSNVFRFTTTIPASMAGNYSFQLASSDEDNAIAVNGVVLGFAGSNYAGSNNQSVSVTLSAGDTLVIAYRNLFPVHQNGNVFVTSTVQQCLPLDSDDDDIPDHLDLDSDNDGIPDNVEGQTTANYVVPNNDTLGDYTTNNGLNTAYITANYGQDGITPNNNDGTDEPDVRDTDSDNTETDDTTEAGLTLSGVDANFDGMDDAILPPPSLTAIWQSGIVNTSTGTTFTSSANLLAYYPSYDGVEMDWRSSLSPDYGDAPAPYKSASHLSSTGLAQTYLGAVLPDFDTGDWGDGTDTNGDATDDDTVDDPTGGVDDEDGVTLPVLIGSATTYSVDVVATNTVATDSYLYAWIDWDNSNTFDKDELVDGGEITIPTGTVQQSQSLTWSTLPAIVQGTPYYVRVRITTESLADTATGSDEDPRSFGEVADGEVEDYRILTSQIDFGDAPDSTTGTANNDYQTTLANGGASHLLADTDGNNQVDITLGTAWDSDTGTLENTTATADDNDGTDDEDGVTLPSQAAPGDSIDIVVTVTKEASSTLNGLQLYAWMDWNADGVWDPATEAVVNQPIAAQGTLTFPTTVPTTATLGNVALRVRVCSTDTSCNSPLGQATDGEVEDYQFMVMNFPVNDVCDRFYVTQAASNPNYSFTAVTPVQPLSFSFTTLNGSVVINGLNSLAINRDTGVMYSTYINGAGNLAIVTTDRTGANFAPIGEVRSDGNYTISNIANSISRTVTPGGALRLSGGFLNFPPPLSFPNMGTVSRDGTKYYVTHSSWRHYLIIDLPTMTFEAKPTPAALINNSTGALRTSADWAISEIDGNIYSVDLTGRNFEAGFTATLLEPTQPKLYILDPVSNTVTSENINFLRQAAKCVEWCCGNG